MAVKDAQKRIEDRAKKFGEIYSIKEWGLKENKGN